MTAPRYYSMKLYGLGPFPKFIYSFKTKAMLNKWISMARQDGWTRIEVYRDKPRQPGQIGIERELIKTIGE